jgi:uncharacterized damage-inducible protein DinB
VKLTDMFLAELDREAATTRRILERVPEGQTEWKPHPKSMQLGYLSTLVATMLGWIEMIVTSDEFDFAPPGVKREPVVFGTRQELIAALDEAVAKSRKALQGTTDEHLLTTWRLKAQGHVVTELPRHINIRDAVLGHLAHHRGQLTVYLRLNDAPVPALYGPSADEPLGR